MHIPLDASTNIEIKGDKIIHGWIQHVWASNQRSYHIAARSNQFSSYLLVLGVMGGPNSFIPKDAIIIKNKDEVLIPLLTTPLPSAKEFKDAIVSLSPEQQAFARSFRAMQLETSVFGLCIVQIKPQLERLLNLPSGSLTKEIKLTQDLMSLFIEYQIPSDLLAFDVTGSNAGGGQTEQVNGRVPAVKSYVKTVLNVIEEEKEIQLNEMKQRDEMTKRDAHPTGSPSLDEYSQFDTDEKVLMDAMPRQSARSGRRLQSTHARMMAAGNMDAEADMLQQQAPMKMKVQPFATNEGATMEGGRINNDDGASSFQPKKETKSSINQERKSEESKMSSNSLSEDFTMIPKLLDIQLEQNDKEGFLRTTIIQTDSNNWRRKRQASLILPPSDMSWIEKDKIDTERHSAFDLLRALSQSGSIALEDMELHIVVATSHCFSSNILDTVIQDNINPIEKVEKSVLMLASLIHNQSIGMLTGKETES